MLKWIEVREQRTITNSNFCKLLPSPGKGGGLHQVDWQQHKTKTWILNKKLQLNNQLTCDKALTITNHKHHIISNMRHQSKHCICIYKCKLWIRTFKVDKHHSLEIYSVWSFSNLEAKRQRTAQNWDFMLATLEVILSI